MGCLLFSASSPDFNINNISNLKTTKIGESDSDINSIHSDEDCPTCNLKEGSKIYSYDHVLSYSFNTLIISKVHKEDCPQCKLNNCKFKDSY